jgi:hypothetical protein
MNLGGDLKMIVINKQTAKMLRYIKRKDEPTAGEIIKRFKLDGDMELINLCREQYLLCRKDDGTFTDFSDGEFSTSSTFKYWATPKTDKYLEDRNQNLFKWAFPTLIALISLLVSIIALIQS